MGQRTVAELLLHSPVYGGCRLAGPTLKARNDCLGQVRLAAGIADLKLASTVARGALLQLFGRGAGQAPAHDA